MAQTLYASFADASLAEKAAGALLDHGVRNEDISLISREHTGDYDPNAEKRDYTTHAATLEERRAGAAVADTEDTVHDAGRGTVHGAESVGNRMAEGGDRFAAGASRAVGADRTADNLEATADRRDADADYRAAQARTNAEGATDRDWNKDPNRTWTDDPNWTNDPNRDPNTTVIDHTTGEGDRTELAAKQGLSTTTPGDAAAGAAKGAGIGLGVGILAALASIAIPGFGLVVGGGALATAIAGAAGATAAGAVAGGVHGYLKDQGVPDHVAMDYNKAYEHGGAILGVTVPSNNVDEATVREILSKYGASNVNVYGNMAAAA
jgi:hypothetical protein